MQQKKILIVSASFYPKNSPRSFRTTELAKELVRQGHKVTVLTHSSKETKYFAQSNGIVIKDLGEYNFKLDLTGNKFSSFLKRGFLRVSKLFFEFPDIQYYFKVRRKLKDEKNYDALISIAVPYPIHWGVASVWRKNNNIAKTWIADCGDPYMGAENDNLKKPFYFKYIEKWFCKKVDFLTVPTTNSIEGYYNEFHSKIKVIPQGFKFEDVKTQPVHKEQDMVKFAYAGVFIPGRRDPREFCDYLIKQNINFQFYIYSSSHMLVEKYQKASNGKVICEKFIPREELLFNLGEMDFVINFENAGGKQTPSKLIDYAIINKPILSIKTGDLKTDVVDEFLNKNYSNAFIVENVNQYKIENVAKEFIKLIG